MSSCQAPTVTVRILYDATGQLLDNTVLAVSVNAVIIGEKQLPGSRAVPPYQGPLVTCLEVTDPQYGPLFLAVTLADWKLLVKDATVGTGGAVESVFGRTGEVDAENNDYNFGQIGDKPTTLAGYGITDPVERTTNKATNLNVVNDTLYTTTSAVYGAIMAAGLGANPALACQVASNDPLPFSPIYDNGAGGVGATITGGSNGDVSSFFAPYTPVVGKRALIMFESNQAANGIYIFTDLGSVSTPFILTRATDFDTPAEINSTDVIPVEIYDGPEGEETNSFWLSAAHVDTVGLDPIIITRYSYGVNIIGLKTDALTQFSPTTSAELASIITDETGTGLLVFNANPTMAGVTLADATDVVGNAGTGNKIGTAANQKFGFFGATPVAQQSGNPFAALAALGLVVSPSLSSANLAAVVTDETGTGLLVFNTNPNLSGATLADGTDVIVATGTGSKIGTAANQKIGFFGATPVVQQSGNPFAALATLGLVASPSMTSANLAAVVSDETGTGLLVFNANPTMAGVTLADATDVVGNAGTGNKIGTAANQKFGFFGATPVAQPTSVDISAALVSLGLVATPIQLPEAKGGTNQTTYALGDILVASATNTLSKLPGNTTTTKQFLVQTGNGAISAAPEWGTLASSDIPDLGLTYGRLNMANTWTAAQRGSFVTLTDQATIAVNMALANCFKLVINASRTVGIPTNIVAGQTGVFLIKQTLTGSAALAWSVIFTFGGGAAPSLTPTKGAVDILPYIVNSHMSSAAITGTNFAPGVFTWTAHGLDNGDHVWFTAGTTTVPALNTVYWAHVIDANTFNLASSLANLGTGTYITTSGISGTLTGASGSITISNILGVQ